MADTNDPSGGVLGSTGADDSALKGPEKAKEAAQDAAAGSAFDHLTEQTFGDDTYLIADITGYLTVGDQAANDAFVQLHGEHGVFIYAPDAATVDEWTTAALTVYVNGEDDPRLLMHRDGSFHWGGGDAAPGTHLVPREDDTGLVFNDDNENGLTFGPANFSDDYVEIWNGAIAVGRNDAGSILRFRGIGDSDVRFTADRDGKFSWGDGANPADFSLSQDRVNWGLVVGGDGIPDLYVGDPSGTTYTDISNGSIFCYNPSAPGNFVSLHPLVSHINSADVAGTFTVTTAGAGIRAKSPDGTVYKLVPPDGGGAASWVAA